MSFALAFMAGANDIPTSFGASVGSGVLTLRQSVVLAVIMEILGATLLGNHSIDGIESCIFKERPDRDLMMWGFMIAMIAATIWLALATYMEMPVTSSLSIQGALIGIALTIQGWNSIYWSKHDSGSVLHVGGVTAILLSWVVAPLNSLVGATLFFGLIKSTLLRSRAAERRTLWALPFFYGLTVLVLILFIIYRGAPGTSLHDMTVGNVAVIASSSAAFTVLLASLIVVLLVKKRVGCFDVRSTLGLMDTAVSVSQDTENQENGAVEEQKELSPEELLKQFNELRVLHTVYEGDEEEAGDESPQAVVKCSPVCGPTNIPLRQLLARTPNGFSFKRLRQPKKLTMRQKIAKVLHKSRELTFDHKTEYGRKTLVQHALAEKFEQKVEDLFSFLLILSASVIALAHGSNDVASIMGPYAGILNIFKSHKAEPAVDVLAKWNEDFWVRVLGGIGVSMGYAVWGWKLVQCLGGKLAFLTPSRAFSAQICTLATVTMASRIKFPISTTHIFIGAILGVSIADNIKNTNWQLMGAFVLTWGLTLVLTCGFTSAFYAFTIFSPSVSVGE